jgi:hypothetical protein
MEGSCSNESPQVSKRSRARSIFSWIGEEVDLFSLFFSMNPKVLPFSRDPKNNLFRLILKRRTIYFKRCSAVSDIARKDFYGVDLSSETPIFRGWYKVGLLFCNVGIDIFL